VADAHNSKINYSKINYVEWGIETKFVPSWVPNTPARMLQGTDLTKWISRNKMMLCLEERIVSVTPGPRKPNEVLVFEKQVFQSPPNGEWRGILHPLGSEILLQECCKGQI
jgi:hypothetical protein